MKNRLAILVTLCLMAVVSPAFAQNPNSPIVTSITSIKHDTATALGRDFWFAPIDDGTDQPGEYLRLYITSTQNTTAYVESQGIVKAVPVPAYSATPYTLPLDWEMQSSGIVENKAIHVYDATDDIAVYLLVSGPYGGDGTSCNPTVNWGRDYVVAAYESLYEGFGDNVFDLPSEFTISATLDNTVIQVTPSCDLRLASVYPDSDSVVAFPKGQMFSVTLNRGQSVEYQALIANDTVGFDVTGTVLHANNPVGVVAGSMGSNIPVEYPYPSYITEMIPPIERWGRTYYSGGFTSPQGEPSHDSSMYLFVSSVPNQTIYRNNIDSGTQTVTVLGAAFAHTFVEESGAYKFYSSAPFLVVQYMNGLTYPDSGNDNGAPSELVMTPKEDFGKYTSFIFPISTSGGSQSPYDAYTDIIANVNDNTITFDGKSVADYTHTPIDDTFEVYVIPHIAQATHILRSDSGVEAYAYAYGTDYAFSVEESGVGSASSSIDSFPPIAIISSQCFSSTIQLTDSGYLPGSTEKQSGLSKILIDSESNVSYQLDSNWFTGSPFDTSGYTLNVIDETKPAFLTVTVLDNADNSTTIISTYTPEFSFSDINFGTVPLNGSKVSRSFTVTDTTSSDLAIYSLAFAPGGKYNSSYSFTTSPQLPDTLTPGQAITIFVTFDPAVSADPEQDAQLMFESSMCNSLTINLSASLSGSGVADESAPASEASILQLDDAQSIRVIIPSDWTPPVRLDIYNILGENVYSSSFSATSTFDLGDLPRGVYFYRLRDGEISQTGKVLIGQ